MFRAEALSSMLLDAMISVAVLGSYRDEGILAVVVQHPQLEGVSQGWGLNGVLGLGHICLLRVADTSGSLDEQPLALCCSLTRFPQQAQEELCLHPTPPCGPVKCPLGGAGASRVSPGWRDQEYRVAELIYFKMRKVPSAPSSASSSATSSLAGQRSLDTMLQQEKMNTMQAELKIMIQALHDDMKERIGK
ncbi:hypothetical protein E2320_000010 [Naja naja]|nr:hypothetical protein E2320_000010 [Naja naja]